MNKTVIISDLHIKDKTESKFNDKDFLKDRRIEMIDNTINEIISKKETKRVVLNGDTFHEREIKNQWSAVSIFINNVLTPLLNAWIEIHILLGNHERDWNWDVFSFLKGEISNPLISIYDDITHIEFDDYNAIFVPFMYRWDRNVKSFTELWDIVYNEVFELSNKIKNKSDKQVILFNHNMMSDLPYNDNREINVKLWDIDSVDYVFGWHIHKHEIFYKENKEKGMYVSSFMRSFVFEEETEWYVDFFIDKENSLQYNYIENNSFNFEQLVIEDDNINNYKDLIKENTVYDFIFFNYDNYTEQNFYNELYDVLISKNSYKRTDKYFKSDKQYNSDTVITDFFSPNYIGEIFTKESKMKKEEKQEFLSKLSQCQGDEYTENKEFLEYVDSKETDVDLKKVKSANSISDFLNNFNN